MATPEDRPADPYRAFNFHLEIERTNVASFSEVSGLTAEGDATDYREGTDKQLSVRKLMGLRKYTNLTLKRGYSQKGELWAWYAKRDRRDVAIVLRNENQDAVLIWYAESAWVSKIEGPSFKAAGNEVAMESVEIVHEGLTFQIVPHAT